MFVTCAHANAWISFAINSLIMGSEYETCQLLVGAYTVSISRHVTTILRQQDMTV